MKHIKDYRLLIICNKTATENQQKCNNFATLKTIVYYLATTKPQQKINKNATVVATNPQQLQQSNNKFATEKVIISIKK